MKVLLLIRYFDFGGAENHVCELANELYCSGHEVVLVSRKGRQLKNLHPGIIYYNLNFSSKKAVFHFFKLLQIIHRHQIEIIHAHQRLPLTMASALGRVIKIPVVGTIHSMLRQDVRKKWVRKGFAKVIVVSENSYNGTQKDPLLKKKSICIPNGIYLPEKVIATLPQKLHFCYVSRLDKPHSKLISFLLNEIWPSIIQKYPEAHLSIIGDGQGMQKIRQTASHLYPEILNSITLKGYAEKISHEITDASLVFGVGRVALESLVMGIPVLSVKNNRLGPIITNKNYENLQYGNFIDVNAPAQEKNTFLKIIDDFVINQLFYKNEAIEISKKIATTNNIQHISERTITVYRELLQR